MRRVVITGIGAVSPNGIGRERFWEATRNGVSGVRRITLETATSNQAAVAFWQRHGYRYEGLLRGYYLGRLDAYWMVKQLPPVMPPVTAQVIVPVGED